ncbi:MAG: hypothetical protein U0X40_01330 [Ferruginibacter sp.]
MQQENFSPQDSLQLIQNMIDKTKDDMGDNAIHFLLWGWTIFAACVGQFVLKNVFGFEKHYLVWWIIIPTMIAAVIIGLRQDKKQRISTYVGDSMKYLWTGMGISFFILAVILTRKPWDITAFPVYMLLYGTGTFISGQVLKFKPLTYGGLIAWAMAIAAAFSNADYQLLFGAGSILASYIVPAYLLRSKMNKKTNS